MTTLMHGIDCSFDPLTEHEARLLRLAGVEAFVQCLWTGSGKPPCARENLRAAADAGMAIAGYASLNGVAGGAWHVGEAIENAGDLWDELHQVFVDVELPRIPNEHIRQAVDYAAAGGKPRAIYTSYSKWVENQGNAQDFDDCLLWDAHWSGRSGIQPVDYGRWAGVVGTQYTGGEQVHGQLADRNVFVRELFIQEDIMADARLLQRLVIAELFAQLAAQAARGEPATDTQRAQLRYLAGPIDR